MDKEKTPKYKTDSVFKQFTEYWSSLDKTDKKILKEMIIQEMNEDEKELSKKETTELNLYVADIMLKRSKRYILAKSEEDIIKKFDELSKLIISNLVDDYIDDALFKIGNIEKVREADPMSRRLLLEDLVDRHPFFVSDDNKELDRISKLSHEELCDCLVDAMNNSMKSDDSVDEKSKIKVEFDLEVDKQGEYVVNMKYKSDEEKEK